MAQKKINWTTQQSRAIAEHARDVFVSASAGTGKTAVMSAGCVDAVKNISACPDVWSVLVVTFTDMAAEQMRSRRQLVLLGAADISTIHSFCKRLITEHFYELGLDPTFGIIDADEAKLLKAETLEKTIDWAWKQPNLADGLRQLLARRDLRLTDGFPAVIIEISDFLDTVVSRPDWLARAKFFAEATDPFATDLAEGQRKIITEHLQNAFGRLDFALKIYRANNPAGEWSQKCERDYIAPVRQFLEWFEAGRWDTAESAIIGFQKPTVFSPKDLPPALGDLIGKMVRTALDTVKGLKDLAILNPDYLSKFAGAVGSQTLVLIELVKQFDLFYTKAKKAINCLDFADLEHHALRLLTSEVLAEGKIKPSQVAGSLRQKYKYVFVDECQDINSVQQAILDMVGSPGNVFAVGDPKQSIYQWRGARPEIFLERLKLASTEPKAAGHGLRVDLNVNFRSGRPILDFVNAVFSRIMTASFANIDYDASARLQPAPQARDEELAAPAVELHILDKSQSDEGEAEYTNRQLQAVMIADRIKQLVGADAEKSAMQILDRQTGASRPVEYRDIVILMRSLANKSDFVELLRLSGVPVSCEATAGYFEATEITDMLSLLKVLDNPRRDIPLAAVLRSPLFNLTDTDLAKIRLHGKADDNKLDFYDCVIACSKSAELGLTDKLSKALAKIDHWRTLARRGRLAELIWQIYRQSGLFSFVCALPDGRARKANLLKLHDRAVQFEGFAGTSGVPSLTRFIDFIEKLLAAGEDWSPAEPEAAAPNAVRVLSVHKSKGLEFPVVFVADLDSRFSKKDSKLDCLMDERFTLGLRIIDTDTNTRLDSLGYQVTEHNNRRKSLAEEMRILYVAMTRAMDRLVLVGCKDSSNCRSILTAASFFENQPIPQWYLESCQSHLDWILSALTKAPLLHKTFETGLATPNVQDNVFTVRLYDQPELARLVALVQNAKHTRTTRRSTKSAKRSTQDLALLKQRLSWRYQFGDAPLLPAKRTVTQWTHRNDEFVRIDYSTALSKKPAVVLAAPQTGDVDRRAIGTATHLVISRIDLSKPVTPQAVRSLTNTLVADGAITQPIALQIDAESIVGFFDTELGRMALDRNYSVQREWPFTFAVPASQWKENDLEQPRHVIQDSIIVQGIIDLLIETPNGLLVVDFKTDDVSAEEVARRADLYRTQLDLYAQAAEAITGRKILAKWLYFLSPHKAVEV